MFDMIPLRVIPPMVFGGIVYGPVGLLPTVPAFWKFLLILVLFNLTTASVILLISIAMASSSVASLVGTTVILYKYVLLNWMLRLVTFQYYSLLFAGLLINRETLGNLSWLLDTSISHAAYEALVVNEMRYLQLKETKVSVGYREFSYLLM